VRILVAFDGTEGAREALRVASGIAAPHSGALVVCWVLNPLLDAADVVAASTAEAMAQVEERASDAIDDALEGLDATATVRIETVSRGEDVAERLARIAAEEGATLLAIASRRAVGWRGNLMGSIAQEVLRLSPCPVVIVRPDQRD
jgi:nucleotide-binding universal stress UspA family protein